MTRFYSVVTTLRYTATQGNRFYYDNILPHLLESQIQTDVNFAELPVRDPLRIGD